jgi:hypothetical protein
MCHQWLPLVNGVTALDTNFLVVVLLFQVMRSYREAQQVADALSDLGVLLRFACMWDPKAYKARQHTVAGLRKDTNLIRWG